jgi:hypothetical protein
MLWITSPVSASLVTTITVTDTAITVECTDNVAPMSDPVCQGITGGSLTVSGSPSEITGGTSGSLSSTNADLYDLPNSNESTEAQALDILLDGLDDNDWVGSDGAKTDAGGIDTLSFTSTAGYIAFAIGGGQLDGKHFFLGLGSPGLVNLVYNKNGQTGGGFSHYTEFGVSPVPVPAAIWLFGTALIGFIGISRRTKV